MHDISAEITATVRRLKTEGDTWKAVAMQYKAAFEAQTSRLNELQDVCFATQAELENERAQVRRQNTTVHTHTTDGILDSSRCDSFGSAVVFPNSSLDRAERTRDDCINPLFSRVQHCIDQRNYGTALVEIERLLRGPLSPKARAEGLLLKSTVLRAAGPDELYEAFAACSEAMELCDRLSDLESFLPRVQYQRGVLYYQLRMLHQAKDVSSSSCDNDSTSATVDGYRQSCDEEIALRLAPDRRSGFDEHRTFTQGLIAHLEEKGLDNNRRRLSAQLRMKAAAKAKRMSLPHRWVDSKSDAF